MVAAMCSLFPDSISKVTASTSTKYRFDFLGWCEFPKGLVVRADLRDDYELGLINGGEGKLQMEARSIKLSSGIAYVVVPGGNHAVVPARDTRLSGVFFNIKAERNFSDDVVPPFSGLEKARLVKTQALQKVVIAVLEHHAVESKGGRISASLLAPYVVTEVLGGLADKPNLGRRIQLAEKYLSFNHTVGAAAQMVGFESPSQLSRLF